MNELIKVSTNTQGEKVVNARELFKEIISKVDEQDLLTLINSRCKILGFNPIKTMNNNIEYNFKELFFLYEQYLVFCKRNEYLPTNEPKFEYLHDRYMINLNSTKNNKGNLPVPFVAIETIESTDYNDKPFFFTIYVTGKGKILVSSEFLQSFNENDFYANTKKVKTVTLPKTYIMIDNANGFYKIGKSIDPKHRERTLQSEKLTIQLVLVIDKDIEKELHIKFKEKRVRGEWFRLDNNDLIFLNTLLCKN